MQATAKIPLRRVKRSITPSAIHMTSDEILITGGEYVENVKLTDGLSRTIRGGYANDDGVWTADSPEPTVINGNEVGQHD